MRVWSCTIGRANPGRLARNVSPDEHMRQAVTSAYRELTGFAPHFIVSGWSEEENDEPPE